jgi:hypothetical protein
MAIEGKHNPDERLNILIPEVLAGNLRLSRNVVDFIGSRIHEVVYLVVLEELSDQLQVTRSMVVMKAMTADRLLEVKYQIISKEQLISTLRQLSSSSEHVMLPQVSNDRSGAYKFIPIHPSDWPRLPSRLALTRQTISGSQF